MSDGMKVMVLAEAAGSARGISFRQAAIFPDAVATAYHAVKTRGRVKPEERVLIVGGGGIGVHAWQLARMLGAEVVVAEREPEKLQRLGKIFGWVVLDIP